MHVPDATATALWLGFPSTIYTLTSRQTNPSGRTTLQAKGSVVNVLFSISNGLLELVRAVLPTVLQHYPQPDIEQEAKQSLQKPE